MFQAGIRIDSQEVEPVWVAYIRHRNRTLDRDRQVLLDRYRGHGLAVLQSARHDRAVKDPILDAFTGWCAGLPVALGIEMGPRLPGIAHPVDQCELTPIEDGAEIPQAGMQPSEIV